VRLLPDDRQLAEVLIQRHKHPARSIGLREDFSIGELDIHITDPHDVMSGGDQLADHAAPDTGV
jgi:hypothetical protein